MGNSKRERHKSTNVLVRAISRFSKDLRAALSQDDGTVNMVGTGTLAVNGQMSSLDLQESDFPKRYTIYEPMLLLPSNFTTHSYSWQTFYSSLNEMQRQSLFTTMADEFCNAGQHVTHIALNAPIEQTVLSESSLDLRHNVMRSPTNLQPLYGDFGPVQWHATEDRSESLGRPSQKDFEAALWVETSQVGGVRQVWAPRWTMFSRGNIREKARILKRSQQQNEAFFTGLNAEELNQAIEEVDVVDMYVGIGYFAIPYLKRGVRRVFGWELNGWSVEGLRRGCKRNGFGCEVVTVEDAQNVTKRSRVVAQVIHLLKVDPPVQCIVFHGDNQYAAEVLNEVESSFRKQMMPLNIRHCNLGLLPTSSGSWESAVRVIDTDRGGWMHVHENAEVSQVASKRQAVVDSVTRLVQSLNGPSWQASCLHTEMVKTYAPGVGHFVFDLRLWPPR